MDCLAIEWCFQKRSWNPPECTSDVCQLKVLGHLKEHLALKKKNTFVHFGWNENMQVMTVDTFACFLMQFWIFLKIDPVCWCLKATFGFWLKWYYTGGLKVFGGWCWEGAADKVLVLEEDGRKTATQEPIVYNPYVILLLDSPFMLPIHTQHSTAFLFQRAAFPARPSATDIISGGSDPYGSLYFSFVGQNSSWGGVGKRMWFGKRHRRNWRRSPPPTHRHTPTLHCTLIYHHLIATPFLLFNM